jgi:hypothetical protein
MENNDKQLIDQALSFVNENNRFAMKTITKNSVSRSNFYKLSIDLPAVIKKDDDDSKTPVVPVISVDDPLALKSIDDLLEETDKRLPRDKSKDESEDESKDKSKDKSKKEPKKKLYQMIQEWYEKDRIKFIKDRYGIDATALTDEEVAKMLGHKYNPGSDLPSSNILNTNIGKDR